MMLARVPAAYVADAATAEAFRHVGEAPTRRLPRSSPSLKMRAAMEATDLLAHRASNGKLRDPAPDEPTLRAILESALRAPDHGLLRPWRLLLVRGAAREALGQVLHDALLQRKPHAAPEELAKERRKLLRAPLVIVVVARPRTDPKVPEPEQVMSAGLVAYGLVLAAQAHGFAGMWRTGPAAYDPVVHRALGLEPGEQTVGFIYLGTPAQPAPPITRPNPDTFAREWKP